MNDPNEWRSHASRQRMVQNIDNLLKSKPMVQPIDIAQLQGYENGIYNRSNSQEDYKSKLTKLLQHLQTTSVQQKLAQAKQQQQQQQQQQQANLQMQQQQQSMYQSQQGQLQQPTQGLPNQGMQSMPGHMHQMQGQAMAPNTMPGQPMQSQMNQGPMAQQMNSGPMPQQMGPGQPISQQMGPGQPMMSANMPGGPYSADPPFSQSPAPSQPQIPPQATYMTRPVYSPNPSMPLPSPTQGMIRAPQPSPSMSISVNTPAPSTAMTPQDPQAPSPASFPPQPQSASDEDQMYMDKVRELSSYIEPLKKMLGKMAKEGRTNVPDYNKLGVLLNLLQPSNNKTTYETLCKCEDVLKKLKLPTPFKTKEGMSEQSSHHWCQPLLTAVAESMKASTCKNALRQTFGPAMHVLYGPNIGSAMQQRSLTRRRKRSSSPPPADAKLPRALPHLIQGELARLDRKFRVTRDKSSGDVDDYNNGLGLRLQCTLEAKGLPSIPAIKFTLPDDYPATNPLCQMSMELYDTSEFFIDIKTNFTSSVRKLQSRYSMTELLETWLASVKQSCSNLKRESEDLKPPIAVTSG